MDRKDALSEKLLVCDRIDTNPDSDNLIEEIRTMIESERLRQTKWQGLTVFCLAALGVVSLMLVGLILFLPATSVTAARHVEPGTGPTQPGERSVKTPAVGDDGRTHSGQVEVHQLGLVGTVVPIVFVVAIVLVLAFLVSAVMRWAATRSVGNAVIQEQLLDLTRQVEQLQGRTEG